MKLYIKYMVSLRSMMLAKSEVEKLGLTCIDTDLGMIDIKEDISMKQLEILNKALKKSGLELLDVNKEILVDTIIAAIVEMIHNTETLSDIEVSEYISQKLNRDYAYLSDTFSKVKGISIERYIKLYKIEKVKELLMYDGLSLTECAQKLHYSSVDDLSNEFKKITGLSPAYFKGLKKKSETSVNNHCSNGRFVTTVF